MTDPHGDWMFRLHEPGQTLPRTEPPLVKADPVAVALVIACFIVTMVLVVGVVVWKPGP